MLFNRESGRSTAIEPGHIQGEIALPVPQYLQMPREDRAARAPEAVEPKPLGRQRAMVTGRDCVRCANQHSLPVDPKTCGDEARDIECPDPTPSQGRSLRRCDLELLI